MKEELREALVGKAIALTAARGPEKVLRGQIVDVTEKGCTFLLTTTGDFHHVMVAVAFGILHLSYYDGERRPTMGKFSLFGDGEEVCNEPIIDGALPLVDMIGRIEFDDHDNVKKLRDQFVEYHRERRKEREEK